MSAGVMPLIRLAWARLSGRTRTELLSSLGSQLCDGGEIERGGNPLVGHSLLPGNVDFLAGHVAGVFYVVFDLSCRRRTKRRQAPAAAKPTRPK